MTSSVSQSAYAFDLHLFCGGYAYFSTFTMWAGRGEHGREKRVPSTVNVPRFSAAMAELGHEPFVIQDDDDYEYWLRRRGWALASDVVARGMMQQWLQGHECLKSALDTFVDTAIASPNVLKHKVSGGRRRTVAERDGGRCLACGKTEADGVKITMHHVRPHSRGGETTSRNLVALCKECNEAIGDERLPEFYELAGIPHSVDLGLIRGENSERALARAFILGDNLMHTRCEVY